MYASTRQSMSRCTIYEIEDEKHFLFVCSWFNHERNFFFENVTKICKTFATLDDKDKLIRLMFTENASNYVFLVYLNIYI